MQTIGQKLKQAREEKRLTLEKVFEAIRIRVQYLQALEADDLSAMPSPVQARGYLRNYAEFLGLNFDQLLEDLRAQSKPSDEMITPMDSVPVGETQTPEPVASELETPPPAPKPARRKKTVSQPSPFDIAQGKPDPSPSKPRRGRKKAEPEPEPILASQPEVVEEPVIEVEREPLPEPIVETQQEEIPQPDVSENLWQTWLNRLSSVISVRVKRKNVESDSSLSEVQPADSEKQEQTPVLQIISTEIFKEIGVDLRERREMLSLHLDEVERNTHVKAHYLEALEAGAMDNLPSTVQTRGMLSNYASFLDLDVDAILLRYADALQARHREKNPQKPPRPAGQPIVPNIPQFRTYIAGDVIFGIGIAVLLVGFSVWGVSRVLRVQNEQNVEPTAPSISDVLLATSDPSLFTPTATLAFVEANLNEPTVTIVIPTQNLNVNVQVNLVAVQRTYMRVIVDGEEVFNDRVMPGNAYLFEAETQVEVLVGNGAGVRVVYNGRDLGLLGAFGQVVSNIYLEEEIITPTALPTQIPTNTLTPTATVPPTQTPIPSSTPRTTLTP